MRFYWLALGILGVWRITHLLASEAGPWDLVVRLRRAAGAGFWGVLLDCFYCLSVWVALPFGYGFGESWGERLLLWPALSAGAILLERITQCGPAVAPAPFLEDEGDEHGLLWKTEGTDAGDRPDPPGP